MPVARLAITAVALLVCALLAEKRAGAGEWAMGQAHDEMTFNAVPSESFTAAVEKWWSLGANQGPQTIVLTAPRTQRFKIVEHSDKKLVIELEDVK
jgi:hypothetical protein